MALQVDIVTITPHRIRFLAFTTNGGSAFVTVTNAQLVAAAMEPLKTIIQRAVADNDGARQVMLGTGTPGNIFKPVPTTQPQEYCRVRLHMRTLVDIDSYFAVDALANLGVSDLQFHALSSDADTSWVIDLEVEHTLTR